MRRHLSYKYGVQVVRDSDEANTFPLVEIKPLTTAYVSSNLSYSEQKDRFSYQIDIYGKDKTYRGKKYYGDEIVLDLSLEVEKYFNAQGYRVVTNTWATNIDTRVKRRVIRVEAIYSHATNTLYKT